ncbi:MAG: 4Fe-4S binding protein [Candidatus Methanomethylophilaceae archaeon]|nr:4Fe-4S binding protein [Candidatus Methanomethylophilaceae archaeon]
MDLEPADAHYRTRDHIDEYTSKCTGCGRCREVCPSYRHGGCDPLAVMRGELRRAFDCVGCGRCTKVCPHTDPKTVMLAAYSIVLDRPVSPDFYETGLNRPVEDHPARTELEPVWRGDDVYVMPGCIVRCMAPHLEYAMAVTLDAVGERGSVLPDFTCCMYPIQFGSMPDAERDAYRIRMGETASGREMVNMCAGCTEIMGRSGVACGHLIPFLHRRIGRLPRLERSVRVSLEPGCAAEDHLRGMEEVVRAMGCEPVGNEPGCCGKSSRNAAGPLMAERQAAAADADLIVVGCPMCLVKYDSVPGGKPVVYLAELVAAAHGDRSTLRYHGIPVDL